MDFNKIVKKMWKNWWKIYTKNDVFELIDPEKKEKNLSKLNTLLSQLKSNGIIISLKSGIYIVPTPEDTGKNEIDLVDDYFYPLLKKIISSQVWSNYYISGNKALEFHMKNYSIPQRIIVMNRSLEKKIYIGEKIIIFRTIKASKKHKNMNLFSKFFAYTKTLDIYGLKFRCANLELSLLESALVNDGEEGIDIGVLTSALKKYKSVLDPEIFQEIGKYKYIMSVNRLKEIAKPLSKDLYEVFLEIIKKNGGNFIGEWLRNF